MSATRWRPFVALAAIAGCTYAVPYHGPAPEPGKRLVVGLAQPIQFQLVEARLENITEVEGTVLETTPDSLVLAARSLRSGMGTEHPALGAAVRVAWSDTTAVLEKRTSVTRTVLVIGLGAAGAVAALLGISEIASGGGGGGGPPKQQ